METVVSSRQQAALLNVWLTLHSSQQGTASSRQRQRTDAAAVPVTCRGWQAYCVLSSARCRSVQGQFDWSVGLNHLHQAAAV
jgi:hypothetical protein